MEGEKARTEVEAQGPCSLACIDLPLYEVKMPFDERQVRVISSVMDVESTGDVDSVFDYDLENVQNPSGPGNNQNEDIFRTSNLEVGTNDPPESTLSTGKGSTSSHGVVEVVKQIMSGALLSFSIVMVGAAIFTKQTTATGENSLHPVVAFVVFWILLLWLALLEGGLNCMVGLKPLERTLFATSHPLSSRATMLAHKGNNLERFIVGRQYLDLTIVFVTSFMVSTVDEASVLGLPQIVSNVFLDSGLAVILVTIVIGQLVSQINAAQSMLDFTNNYVMLASTYAALTVEASGILHAVYLIQILVAKAAGCPVKSDEPERTIAMKAFFWGRVIFSTSLLVFATTITIKALFDGNTTMWEGVPATVSLILLVLLIGIVGLMESMQIALFAVVHRPAEELQKHPVAQKICQAVFKEQTLESFLCGRQIFQTILMFAIARIISIDAKDGNILGVGDTFQRILNSGVLGALISTIIASLSWRILASSFPIFFLSNPFSPFILKLCLLIEASGICSIAWSIAKVQKRIAGYRADSEYIGESTKTVFKDDNSSSENGMTDKSSEDEEEP